MSSHNTQTARWEPEYRRASLKSLLPISLVLLVFALLTSLTLGPLDVPVSPKQVLAVMSHHVFGTQLASDDATQIADQAVWGFRLPRAVAAALIGVLLALAGVALQGMLMNPLADPYTVGVSAGAAVGAAGAELAGVSAAAYGLGGIGCAFAAGIGAVIIVYALSRVDGRVSSQTFLLAGVIVGAMLWSLIPLAFTLAHQADDLTRIMNFLIGSLQSADWTRVYLLLPFVVISAAALGSKARELNLVTLGEETASHLGIEIDRFRRSVLLIAAAATAAAVSIAGIIGFVGLVTPHLARRLSGPDHRALLPLAAIFGAILLIFSDTLTRVYLNDKPVGVVTAIVGAPVFCLILRSRSLAHS